MKEIKYLSLKDLNAPYEKDIQHAISEVVSSGWYLQGKRIHDFEEHYAAYIGTRHCISCGNGLDALKLMLQGEMILGRMQPGDEVLVAANTYIDHPRHHERGSHSYPHRTIDRYAADG